MGFKRLMAYAVTVMMFFTCAAPSFAGAQDTKFYAETELLSDHGIYNCDFLQLIKDGNDTQYGGSADVFELDEYTKAVLTYAGTYVSADGRVYLKSDTICNKNSAYKNGSYISFTAPSDGTIEVSGSDIGWFEGDTYKGYGPNITIEASAGTVYNFGYRKESTYIGSLIFTPSEGTIQTPEPSPGATEPPAGEGQEYQSPSTTWDFDSEAPSLTGTDRPVLSGSAEYDSANGEIKFPFNTTEIGKLSIEFSEPIKATPKDRNIRVSFDIMNHVAVRSGTYIGFSICNSEGEEIISFETHPYSYDQEKYPAKGLVIGGVDIAGSDALRDAGMSAPNRDIEITAEIDYYSRTAVLTVGETKFSGSIPESAVQDIKTVEVLSRRTATHDERYLSLDNFSVSEFSSEAEPAPEAQVAHGYDEGEAGGMPYRIARPENEGIYPLVIYLHSASRNGTDNVSQLYQAQYLFGLLKNKAVLVAPQTGSVWTPENIMTLAESIIGIDSDAVYIIGQGEGAGAALKAAAENPNIFAATIAIDPKSELSEENTAAISEANTGVYVFSGYQGENMDSARKIVNKLQTSGMTDVLYTEYPYDEGNMAEKAANTLGLEEWLFEQTLSNNTAELSEERVVDLAIFMGQSNMAGRGDYEEAVGCPAGHGFEYHPVTDPGVLTTVTEPFGKYENNENVNDNGGDGTDRRSGDMVAAFTESYYSVSGTPLVGVQCSRGGTESRWWNTETVLNEAAARYNEAKEYLEANGYTIGKQFMVWCQGCSDADNNRSIETYKSNTKEIFETMKSNTGLTDMFMIRIGHCKTSGAAAIDTVKDPIYKSINLAQKELADETEGITAVASFYTDEYAALMRDQYHYYQPAYDSVGKTAGNNTAVTLYAAGEWENYPEPEPDTPSTPMPVDGVFELTSSEEYIDVSGLRSYGSSTYRVYTAGGSYETVSAPDGIVNNNTGGEVTIVPEYRFEFTNRSDTEDINISGYVKVTENSYTEEKGYGLLDGNYSINENGCRPDESAIKVDLAEGFYDISVYRLGGCRADIYSGGRLIANNTTSSGAQNRGGASALMEIPGVKLPDGSIDLTFGNTSGGSERIASIKIARVPEKYRKPVIWIAGDSESSNYYPFDSEGSDLESDRIMITGFGQQLSKMLSDKYSVSNYGQPSATVKTWYDECFDSVNELMQPGDTLLIDFGINDSISSSNKITIDEMKEQILLIAEAAKAKDVTPILISPVYNSKYQHRTYFAYDANTGSNEMYQFAEENGIACIDLNKYTQLYVNAAEEETGDAAWVTNNYHVSDGLHLTQHSALLAASFIAAEMETLGYECSDMAFEYADIGNIESGNVRGNETGVRRIYGVDAARAFIDDGTVSHPASYAVSVSYTCDTVTLTSADSDILSAVALKASYESDGTMKGIKIYPVAFEDSMAEITGVDFSENDKLYVWDSLSADGGMNPLAAVFTYSQSPEQSPEPSPESTEEPLDIIYEQDFEGFEEQSAQDDYVADGWISPAGTASVKTGGASNKYLAVTGGNASRSGYFELDTPVTDNFVFEADLKTSSSSRVSELQLVEDRSSVYQNHGVENTKKYVFTMDRPSNEELYVINNGVSDSGLSLGDYLQPPVITDKIEGDPWIHVKAVVDFDNGTVTAYITSLDGNTVYYRGMTDMSSGIRSFGCIHLLGPVANIDTCIDNIKIYKARNSDLAPVYHRVTMTCGAYTFNQYVENGGYVVNIPDVSSYGTSFEGWELNGVLYTQEQIKSVAITSDCEITGNISDSYIENMASVLFNEFPAGGELVMGADENTYGSNTMSVTVIGEQGTSLGMYPDSRVDDFDVEWTFDGFRVLDGRPTDENGSSYCEGYGLVEEVSATAVDFKLKRTAANYYGRVTAKVTYNGKTLEISRPLVLLGDKSGTELLPKAGYTSDFNKYEDSLIGYRLSQNDLIFGGWSSFGSDASYMDFLNDETGKYLAFSRAATGNSSVIYNEIGAISAQTVFEQDIRFGIDGSISYVGGGTMTSPESVAFLLEKNGSSMSLNGNLMYTSAENDKWYRIVIHADPTSKKCFAKIYDISGVGISEPVAVSDIVDFGTYETGNAYRISLEKNNNGSIDVNNIKIYEAQTEEQSITVSAPQTVNIPESGSVNEELSVSAKTTDGSPAIGAAEWHIDDEFAEGVSISGSGDTAVLTVSENAAPGDIPVRVTVGGASKTVSIRLIGTRDCVAFTEAPAGIRLGSGGEYRLTAVVRNGNAEIVEGRNIDYSIVDGSGAETAVDGVEISTDGMLSVSADAKPQNIFIKATAADGEGESISRTVKLVLYTLDFSFGEDETETGFTKVPADSSYRDSIGFGIDGGAESAEGLTEGTFRLKLEKGKVYEVTAQYSGRITCERINSALSGFVRESDGAKEDVFRIAVFGDGIMDIEVDGTLKKVSVEIVEKTQTGKPDWWTIGDSTVQQNGSWGYTLAANGLDGYPELNAVIDVFHNSGRAGRQHKNYYTEGLFNDVLCEMEPGDVVSISGMGTNDSSSTFEQFKEYDEIYMNAIIDMGGYVILGSYTPSGNYGETSGRVYDSDSMTFRGVRTNVYDRAIRELYEENKNNEKVLGFIDIGQMADDKMTADVRSVYSAAQGTESEKRAAADERAEEMMKWWRDYNHYNSDFSNYILPDITSAASVLINKIK